jgi:hypothetical protein
MPDIFGRHVAGLRQKWLIEIPEQGNLKDMSEEEMCGQKKRKHDEDED